MPRRFTKRTRKQKNTTKAAVSKLAKVVRRIMPEIKYSDTFSTAQQFNYSPTTNYTVQPLTGITQGDADVNERVGDTIFCKYMKIRGTLYNYHSEPFNCRIVICKIKQNIETVLTAASVGNALMESAYSTTVNAVEAPFDNDNSYGFNVLYDRRYCVNPMASNGSTGAVWGQARPFTINLPLNFKSEFFQAGTGSTHNGIAIFFISAAAANVYQYASYTIRTTYTDV